MQKFCRHGHTSPSSPSGRRTAASLAGGRALGQLRLATALGAALAAGACGQKVEPLPDCGFAIDAPTVSYADDSNGTSIARLMKSCAGCHNSTGKGRLGAPRDINLDSYGAVVNHAMQSLASMANGSMPPLGEAVSNEDLCRFDTWIRQKYPR